MKSVRSLALMIGAIMLLPSPSFADNVSGNNQEVNQETTIVGNGNLAITETRQSIVNLQQLGRDRHFTSTAQKMNAKTTIIGDGNTDIKRAIQEVIDGQQTK